MIGICRHVIISASFLAEISIRSPRKIFIFIIYKNVFWIKVSRKVCDLILKTEALVILASRHTHPLSELAGAQRAGVGADHKPPLKKF